MRVNVRVLGCSGGIGGARQRTTSFLVGSNTLIDAGTGVGELDLLQLRAIDHVFVTHSHLDHVLGIPLILDAVGGMRKRPLTVHALPATIEALRKHLFNWTIWPDFTVIPSPAEPGLQFSPLVSGQTVFIGKTVRVTALPAVHVVPALGYQIDSGQGSLVFTGDTAPNPALWPIVNAISNLRHLIIECAFSEADRTLAQLSCHLCPSLLALELAQLNPMPSGAAVSSHASQSTLLALSNGAPGPAIHVTHLKPGDSERTMAEVVRLVPALRIGRLIEDAEFEL